MRPNHRRGLAAAALLLTTGLRAAPDGASDALRDYQSAQAYVLKVPQVDSATVLRLVDEAQHSLGRCVHGLETALATDPALASTPVPGSSPPQTHQQLLDACRQLQTTLAGGSAAPTASPTPAAAPAPAAAPTPAPPPAAAPAPATPAQRLTATAARFGAASEQLNQAMKLAKGKQANAALHADLLFEQAERGFTEVQQSFAELFAADPSLRSSEVQDGSATISAATMAKGAKIRLERAQSKRKKGAAKAKRELKAWSKLLEQALRDGRLQTFQQRGVPDGFDGGDRSSAPDALLHLLPAASFWQYHQGGCVTVVRFAGDSVQTTEQQPPGCS